MENPFLSIVLCTYNGERFLKEQLDSLFNQTYENFEIIAVDDCSTDSTINILQEMASPNKMKVFKNEKNEGVNRNFQIAIQKASGDFILICDQDDIWVPNKLEVLVSSIDGSLLYYHDSRLMDVNGKIQSKKMSDKYRMSSNPHPLAFISQNGVTGHACMFDRKLLEYPIFPLPKHIYYDNWLGYIASIHGQVRYIDNCMVNYRVHENNLTISQKKSRKLNEEISEAIYEQLNSFYEFAHENSGYKTFLLRLRNTYLSNTFLSKSKRVYLFLIQLKNLNFFRKKNIFRKISFSIKMGYKPLPNYFL